MLGDIENKLEIVKNNFLLHENNIHYEFNRSKCNCRNFVDLFHVILVILANMFH